MRTLLHPIQRRRASSQPRYYSPLARNFQFVPIRREAVEHEAFDLILMDCEMPVLDGYQTTQKLRETYAKHQLPIVALTAYGFDANRVRCLQSGMNDHLTKPVSRAELIRVVNAYATTERRGPRAA